MSKRKKIKKKVVKELDELDSNWVNYAVHWIRIPLI